MKTCKGCTHPLICKREGCAALEAAANKNRARAVGVGRDEGNAKSLIVYFDKEPTDDDMRRVHTVLRC